MSKFSKDIQNWIIGNVEDSHVADGWLELVEQLNKDIAKISPTYGINQIKEKFSGLRFYIKFNESLLNDELDAIDLLIAKAESKSFKICEICGESGKLVKFKNGVVSTRCKDHNDFSETWGECTWMRNF